MTFIYENFKSEVIQARQFNKKAQRELETNEILMRWNDVAINEVITLNSDDLLNFKIKYMPTVEQIRSMNDYDLKIYVRKCFSDFSSTKR